MSNDEYLSIMEEETEIWKEIKGWEGLYSVSNYGRAKRHEGKVEYIRNGRYEIKIIREKILTPQSNGRYLHITLQGNGIRKIALVHRLVGEAFVDNADNKKQINHKDGNRKNNSFSNLEWSTQKENVNHYLKIGLKKDFIVEKNITTQD